MADAVLAAADSYYFFAYAVFLAAFVPPFVFCLRFFAGIFVYFGFVIFKPPPICYIFTLLFYSI